MDLATIYVALTLLSFTALLISVNLAKILRTVSGTQYWFVTLVFLALGSILIALRGKIPDILSIEVANALLIFSPACMVISLSKLRAANTSPRVALTLAALGSIAYMLAAELSGMRARLIAISAAHAVILAYGAWLLLGVRGVIGANRMMISWLLIMAALAVVRIFVTASAERIGENYLHDNRFQAFYMFAILASTFGFSAAFIVEVFHRINKDLETERSHLTQSNRAKEMMLRVISHDLRGPLGMMQQLLAALNQKLSGKNAEVDQWALDVIDGLQRQTGRTYRLLQDLLTWSQRNLPGEHKQVSACNIRETCTDAIVFHAMEARRKQIALIMSENMPDVEIRVDAVGLSMVFRNLISNSLKYCVPGCKIEIDGRVDYPHFIGTVTDDGISLSSSAENRLHSGKEVESLPGTLGETGAGIGLMICKDWLEAAGGTLTITRCPVQGTCAEIRLPL